MTSDIDFQLSSSGMVKLGRFLQEVRLHLVPSKHVAVAVGLRTSARPTRFWASPPRHTRSKTRNPEGPVMQALKLLVLTYTKS